jgi:hypothetical protein
VVLPNRHHSNCNQQGHNGCNVVDLELRHHIRHHIRLKHGHKLWLKHRHIIGIHDSHKHSFEFCHFVGNDDGHQHRK